MTTHHTQLTLTKIHRAMLAALADGEWQSRTQLAVALGRHPSAGRGHELYPRDKERIQELVSAGLLECQEPIAGKSGYRYRLTK